MTPYSFAAPPAPAVDEWMLEEEDDEDSGEDSGDDEY